MGTNNHYFTESIQKSFDARMEKKMRKRLEQIFPVHNDQ
jgi:hypothetical protein